MIGKSQVDAEISAFLEEWSGEHQQVRDCFKLLYSELRTMDGVALSFSARPGVSYSLRPQNMEMTGREFFAIIDVIDDDPDNRWLSVCFYQDMITDPKELGECVPGGLAGGNGYCFNLDNNSFDFAGYLAARLHEARAAVAG